MSKRKLTRRQAWRVNKIQQERAERAKRREDTASESLQGGSLGAEQEGLVVAHFGTQVEVESGAGERRRCHLRANLGSLVTGDRVIWCEGDPTGVVVAQLDRKSALLRPDNFGQLKPVAANIDRIFVVIAARPEPHANLIDRYLVASEAVGIEPVLVLNKVDLLDGDDALAAQLDSLLTPYANLGYQLLRVCARAGGSVALETALNQRISIFVGQSGVGKSSLVNSLLPGLDLRVGALSELTHKGTHTTTTAQLFHLPCGGSLIDSPGIREFGLWHMSRDQVEQGFREFRPHLGHCRFRDCQHQQEPGCAILDAGQSGAISPARLESYRRIIASLEADR
ncbi:small ribosomal subunit biogenesis GTPase RsgA [Parahaliea aestuarii]|uniref:Small ribosomal subunit biogenesis GTPase RsgA n=1 Tax=Parahaliea aestuarii TaxID=1852021 RepID=A0A5C8ZL11_9GAMM|nr:small ribosomal subunit biogenesis GTPase RsgA [Parahaliea aestuarii]TXS89138.1 small ribosomal subunit biogenesis GTPase RsgA [Parahaliea aestuarii]